MTGKDPEHGGGTPCIKDRDVLQRINKELSGGLGKDSRDHCFLSPLIYGSNLGRGSVIGKVRLRRSRNLKHSWSWICMTPKMTEVGWRLFFFGERNNKVILYTKLSSSYVKKK
ncbi:hypothetical protein TNCT_364421 [Trichonephila clavata]|uniref:Uncharacterized protein n=1 Tax=Trichonephila clavata TaxID=2740835 RepID=A0A8X6JJ02_TRICU|nr:hypothetical protein TNCT_364421 [Trichonephila clavata]